MSVNSSKWKTAFSKPLISALEALDAAITAAADVAAGLVTALGTAIDALERSGTTVAVGDAAADADRDIVLTIKNGAGTPAAVASYAVVGVKVTKANVGGTADSGDPAVINTDLDTADGLTVVATKGERIPAGAIANSANASLVAITKADGTLTVNIKNTTINSKFYVHFILPDGTVKTSAQVELNAP